jgi:hypothetical protein
MECVVCAESTGWRIAQPRSPAAAGFRCCQTERLWLAGSKSLTAPLCVHASAWGCYACFVWLRARSTRCKLRGPMCIARLLKVGQARVLTRAGT